MPNAPESTVAALVSTLNDPANSAINFVLGGIDVTPARLTAVADAVSSGKIKVVIGDSGGFSATYRAADNTFTLGSAEIATDSRKALIVHESVHAICDLRKLSYMALEGEAAAYTAQAIYFRLHGHSSDRLVHADASLDAVFAAAFDVADAILKSPEEDRSAKVAQLRTAILATTQYGNIGKTRRTGNG